MPSPRFRAFAAFALAALGAAALASCTASADTSGNGPTEASVAVLDEFFAHLENGESTDAAAMTSIDFPAEFIDEDFYAASAALPSDAKVVDVKGSDEHTVTAIVEYVLDDPDQPMTATFKVKNTDGERLISWSDERLAVINVGSPGRLVLNGEMEYPMSADAELAFLLPALYEFTYDDPTGITQLDPDGTNEFTVAWPMDDQPSDADLPDRVNVSTANVSVVAYVEADVTDAVDAQIDELMAACVAERLAGPSCPASVVEYDRPLVDPSTVEWLREPGYGVSGTDGVVEYSKGFTLRADGDSYPTPAVYEGTVTRDAAGVVTFTRK
ncbi:hypothetical protein [Microbacterium sp. Leaf320]|uniref:hypothetical protein n=1 Tax=unclassified Microbacterium TaxID=2609290 RepID=UPI0006F96BBA|nr:hypothetical protein [Microbacterium sp. Leaf320]KQQ66876.1 hypothetical protein ASF63_06385 [Microbacterium sp. Leaf320]